MFRNYSENLRRKVDVINNRIIIGLGNECQNNKIFSQKRRKNQSVETQYCQQQKKKEIIKRKKEREKQRKRESKKDHNINLFCVNISVQVYSYQ